MSSTSTITDQPPAAGPDQPAPVELSDRLRRFLKSLASEGRQQVMLQFAGGAELTVGTVAQRLGIGQSTASEQLSQLRDGGVLTSRREGKTVYYRADPAGIHLVIGELQTHLQACCPPEQQEL